MRRKFSFMVGLSIVAWGAFGGGLYGAEESPAPQVGDTAPDFKLTGSDGKEYKLSEFKDKKAVVLAWFPKAFTGG